MRHNRWIGALLIAGLAVGGLTLTVGGAPADCTIVEGTGIGGVRIGMAAAAALAVTGPPDRQQTVGTQVIYALRAPWWWMSTEYGVVQRVSTRAPECRTARGIAVGTALAAVRNAHAGALPHISAFTPASTPQESDLLTYPLVGIAYRLRQERVEAIEVYRAERLTAAPPPPVTGPVAPPPPPPGTAPPGPTPTPTTAAGSWSVRSTAARVEEGALTVTGTVENRSRTQAVYAEVRAFNPSGRQVGQGEAPLTPTPVPVGSAGTFEVRVALDDVARRYVVIIRPVGAISGSLAEAAGEVKDLQQFASVVARQIQVVTQTQNNPPTRDDFVIAVTNSSPLTVASVTISVEITATCRIPLPTPRTIQEVRSGTTVIQQLRPGATARAQLPVSVGACIEFATWSATFRVGELRIAE